MNITSLLTGALLAAASTATFAAPQASPADLMSANAARFTSTDGSYLYHSICQACHMEDAKGATGGATYPALAENVRLASRQYPAILIVRGLRGMPPLGPYLDDVQVAAVVNYVRSHFGNHYTDVLTADEVKALRP